MFGLRDMPPLRGPKKGRFSSKLLKLRRALSSWQLPAFAYPLGAVVMCTIAGIGVVLLVQTGAGFVVAAVFGILVSVSFAVGYVNSGINSFVSGRDRVRVHEVRRDRVRVHESESDGEESH
mmetsp:Transcript_45359/g.142237  ORF Transcript_45359/g.142237 Transcript_45359/m.142237 type:complete len:121 (-) Transcript_45359:109-471(-)